MKTQKEVEKLIIDTIFNEGDQNAMDLGAIKNALYWREIVGLSLKDDMDLNLLSGLYDVYARKNNNMPTFEQFHEDIANQAKKDLPLLLEQQKLNESKLTQQEPIIRSYGDSLSRSKQFTPHRKN